MEHHTAWGKLEIHVFFKDIILFSLINPFCLSPSCKVELDGVNLMIETKKTSWERLKKRLRLYCEGGKHLVMSFPGSIRSWTKPLLIKRKYWKAVRVFCILLLFRWKLKNKHISKQKKGCSYRLILGNTFGQWDTLIWMTSTPQLPKYRF